MTYFEMQTTGAGDKAHPDLPRDHGGTGENGGQREENEFDRGAGRTVTPTPPQGREATPRSTDNAGEDSARGLVGGE
jgi:hypothetical protein